jgi:hypothetical protein
LTFWNSFLIDRSCAILNHTPPILGMSERGLPAKRNSKILGRIFNRERIHGIGNAMDKNPGSDYPMEAIEYLTYIARFNKVRAEYLRRLVAVRESIRT